jgi:hypothetical protein
MPDASSEASSEASTEASSEARPDPAAGPPNGARPEAGAERAYRIASDAVATEMEDAMVVLLLSEQELFELNRTGATVWQALQEKGALPVPAMARAVADRHPDVSSERAARDVQNFVGVLLERGLLEAVCRSR